MRSIMGALIVLVMIFTVVSISEAWVAVSIPNTSVEASARDMDRPGSFPTGTPYPCIASPAYPDYTDARAVPCPAGR